MRLEIGPVETSPLDAYDRQSVAPLPVGYLAALAIPTELLQQDVFGRMHVERPATAEIVLVWVEIARRSARSSM